MTDSKKRFLVVDDEKMIRFFLKEFFNMHELPVEEATNGKEAIEKWEQHNYVAILMDINMPDLDGLEATQIIRRREKKEGRVHTPIYAISGYTYEGFKAKCDKAGMDGFLPKPVLFNDLMAVILPLANK